jgi:preprotein translocase subunit SecG
MTIIFTVCFVLRCISLITAALLSTAENYNTLSSEFGSEMLRYTLMIVWDLPAILSTLYLNYKLVLELENKKEEDKRTHSVRYREEELAINSEIFSVLNESQLEGSEVFNSPKFEGSENLLEKFDVDNDRH